MRSTSWIVGGIICLAIFPLRIRASPPQSPAAGAPAPTNNTIERDRHDATPARGDAEHERDTYIDLCGQLPRETLERFQTTSYVVDSAGRMPTFGALIERLRKLVDEEHRLAGAPDALRHLPGEIQNIQTTLDRAAVVHSIKYFNPCAFFVSIDDPRKWTEIALPTPYTEWVYWYFFAGGDRERLYFLRINMLTAGRGDDSAGLSLAAYDVAQQKATIVGKLPSTRVAFVSRDVGVVSSKQAVGLTVDGGKSFRFGERLLDGRVDADGEPDEIVTLQWISPAQLIAHSADGELLLLERDGAAGLGKVWSVELPWTYPDGSPSFVRDGKFAWLAPGGANIGFEAVGRQFPGTFLQLTSNSHNYLPPRGPEELRRLDLATGRTETAVKFDFDLGVFGLISGRLLALGTAPRAGSALPELRRPMPICTDWTSRDGAHYDRGQPIVSPEGCSFLIALPSKPENCVLIGEHGDGYELNFSDRTLGSVPLRVATLPNPPNMRQYAEYATPLREGANSLTLKALGALFDEAEEMVELTPDERERWLADAMDFSPDKANRHPPIFPEGSNPSDKRRGSCRDCPAMGGQRRN